MSTEVILPEPQVYEPKAEKYVCPRCGFETPEGVLVCWRCGNRLKDN